MNGAREYADLFTTGQYGRLYISSGHHARGKTFHIYVLEAGAVAVGNGAGNAPLSPEHVEVYGITGGNPGWTETYGWLHCGPWERDFEALVEERQRQIAKDRAAKEASERAATETERERTTRILSSYEVAS